MGDIRKLQEAFADLTRLLRFLGPASRRRDGLALRKDYIVASVKDNKEAVTKLLCSSSIQCPLSAFGSLALSGGLCVVGEHLIGCVW